MDIVDHIEKMILDGSCGFFDKFDVEDLHVTIRIARDFNSFLEKFGENPPTDEIVYVSDTVRSGMDQFFSLAQVCGFIETEDEKWSFDQHLSWNYGALRLEFLDTFERLHESLDVNVVQRLTWLLTLTHLELVFLAKHFPSAMLSGISEGSRRPSEPA
ncbi:hypothetical protein GCM10011507_11480 [Edaphobacter acidisoli]|uniref:Uncharacterized protein n=1 Tax=Edaphobacter acidisoli TaxID=2040573 RepID=A0A916W2H8_9BACT|nr:hypothetical protein [Edaphobacter acidisoli]GGA61647.1 hypothetical protein GCM10011507_11480 [Edaphobacter acidisoli]